MTPSRHIRRTALITGASAGIGHAFAHVFARNGFDLVVTARRLDRLEALAAQIRATHDLTVRVVQEDLADPAAPKRLHDRLANDGIAIDALVNNAGYGIAGRYLASGWEQHAVFLQVMVTSVAELTHRFVGSMVDRRYGRIINVASLAGLVPATPGHTLYAASKAFLIKFSQALALEVRTHGVHVTALCPGFTHTEFHDVLGTRDIVRQLPRWMWMDADTVAGQGFDAVMAGRSVCVTGRVNRTIAFLTRHLPDSALNRIAQRQGRKYRRV